MFCTTFQCLSLAAPYVTAIQMLSIPQACLAATNITNELLVSQNDPDLMGDVEKLIPIAVQHAKVDSVCLLYRDTIQSKPKSIAGNNN